MTSRLAGKLPQLMRLGGPAIVIALAIAGTGTCGPAHADQFPQVRYEVSGGGVADYISYQTEHGQRHATNVGLPWSSEFTGFGGQVFVLSAQGPGAITCRIVVDGTVVTEQTATGAPGHTVCTH
ncbi:Mycobacterium membrane protein [Mycobacterium basiliense]|uniref:Mycobacterium membrane protein n=1 Tax=Mycobacterium basiliense TaxID=2094119 RepID=A0A447GG62_9MYCO|nr:MmpS family transport accessory protein [Mycobacterium basiliense]VDM89455.1 Mycobacterium membrane protein [Mycobacterium basiliense]